MADSFDERITYRERPLSTDEKILMGSVVAGTGVSFGALHLGPHIAAKMTGYSMSAIDCTSGRYGICSAPGELQTALYWVAGIALAAPVVITAATAGAIWAKNKLQNMWENYRVG